MFYFIAIVITAVRYAELKLFIYSTAVQLEVTVPDIDFAAILNILQRATAVNSDT